LGRDIFEGAYSFAGVTDAPQGVLPPATRVPGVGWSAAVYTIYSDRLDIRRDKGWGRLI
jgi:hypothetical protein